jgi:hypothetical protein
MTGFLEDFYFPIDEFDAGCIYQDLCLVMLFNNELIMISKNLIAGFCFRTENGNPPVYPGRGLVTVFEC